ncbi:MAG TPA: T9SS type A sorting domain-containing protein [Flavobacteriales bacterium]|nr:T9SS type A sorting domain-containing protein [Flavobacteriales bacterium]
MRRNVLILIVVVLTAGFAKSQATLRINYVMGSSVNDTITPGLTYAELYGVNVANLSFTYAFSDSLKVNVGVVDTLGQVQVMDINNVGFQIIPMADSITLDTVGVNVNTSYFVDGNNTVVIWPAASGTYTFDSLYYNFVYTSVNEILTRDINVQMGPNPAAEFLYLGDPENSVKQVRIRTVEGKFVRPAHTNAFIFVGDLNEGIYLVEMKTANGIFTRKLIVHH